MLSFSAFLGLWASYLFPFRPQLLHLLQDFQFPGAPHFTTTLPCESSGHCCLGDRRKGWFGFAFSVCQGEQLRSYPRFAPVTKLLIILSCNGFKFLIRAALVRDLDTLQIHHHLSHFQHLLLWGKGPHSSFAPPRSRCVSCFPL